MAWPVEDCYGELSNAMIWLAWWALVGVVSDDKIRVDLAGMARPVELSWARTGSELLSSVMIWQVSLDWFSRDWP